MTRVFNTERVDPRHCAFFARPTRPGVTVRAADRKATIDIYDVIGFWGVSAADVRTALNGIDADEILVRINSPGGDVFDGFAIHNDLANHPATIKVEITGMAASAASVIAMAGDEIAIAENAFLMIHNAWGIVLGDRNDARKFADVLEQIDSAIAATYARRTGIDAAELARMMDDETWMAGPKAVEQGFADRSFAPGKDAAPDDGAENAEASARAMDLLRAFAHTPNEILAGVAARQANGKAAPATRHQQRESDMDIKDLTADQLKAARPDLVAAIETQAAETLSDAHDEGVAKARAAGETAGAEAERARILGIQGHATAGAKDIVAEMVADGATTPDQAAARILAAQKAAAGDRLMALEDDDKAAAVKPSVDNGGAAVDPKALGLAAQKLIRAEAAEGVSLSPDEAVARIMADRAA